MKSKKTIEQRRLFKKLAKSLIAFAKALLELQARAARLEVHPSLTQKEKDN